MLRRMFMMPVVLLFLAAAAGCGDDSSTGPDTANLDGTWSGTDDGVTLTLTLNEDSEGSLSGSGTLSNAVGTAIALTITSGTHVGSSVTMSLSTGEETLNFSGDVTDDDTITGALSGGGVAGDLDVTLRRQ